MRRKHVRAVEPSFIPGSIVSQEQLFLQLVSALAYLRAVHPNRQAQRIWGHSAVPALERTAIVQKAFQEPKVDRRSRDHYVNKAARTNFISLGHDLHD
jgi:hypothetical protein